MTLPRLYAYTLKDRAFVHQPTVIRGNKPIILGHSYSFLAALPEPKGGDYTHWVFPLSAQRIASTQKATEVAQKQFHLHHTDRRTYRELVRFSSEVADAH